MPNDVTPVPPQVGFAAVAHHPLVPTLAAAVCLLLAMVMPLLTASATVSGIPFLSVPFTGSRLFGLAGWLVVTVFAAAVATRTVRAAMPYRRLLDGAALLAWVGLVVWGVLQVVSDPAVSGTGVGRSISLAPALGLVPFLLAGPLAWLSMRRAKQTGV